MSIFGSIARIFGRIGRWVPRGLALLPLIFDAVAIVETLSQAKGKAKQDQALRLLAVLLQVTEQGTGEDLLNDAEVQNAARAVIDAVVAFQNIVARRTP